MCVFFILHRILFQWFSQSKYFASNVTVVLLPHFNSLVCKSVCAKVQAIHVKCFVSYNSIPKGLHVYMLVSRQPKELKNKEFIA